MKLQSKIKLILLCTIIFLMICSAKAFAATISVKPSKTSVSPGESFTVSISSSGATGKVSISASNGSVSPSSLWLEPSGTVTIKAGSSGSIKINVTAVDMSDSSGNEVSPSGSATVSIVNNTSGGNSGGNGGNSGSKPPTTTQPPVEVKKSTDNTLSALSIEGGQISPEFNKDVKEYALKVPYEVAELNVTAKPNDSKAKVEVIGNKDLQEGENILTVRVTAEDGSASDYVVKVTRARIPLALKSLVIKYQNENGEIVETPLNPVFSFDVFEYSLEEMEYWVKELSVEALPNIEGANIDVQGADSLQAGENKVTITAKISAEVAEGEEPKEEIITYTIKFNRKQEPTTMEKISNWYKQNERNVIISALGVCIVFLFGLSIYIVVDYNKYKHVVKKVKEANDFKSNNIFEEETSEEISEEEKDTAKAGKRFK